LLITTKASVGLLDILVGDLPAYYTEIGAALYNVSQSFALATMFLPLASA
jgi:hypothetical protein